DSDVRSGVERDGANRACVPEDRHRACAVIGGDQVKLPVAVQVREDGIEHRVAAASDVHRAGGAEGDYAAGGNISEKGNGGAVVQGYRQVHLAIPINVTETECVGLCAHREVLPCGEGVRGKHVATEELDQKRLARIRRQPGDGDCDRGVGGAHGHKDGE